MLEEKRKGPGLDLNLPRSHESRLEPDAFLADIALRPVLELLPMLQMALMFSSVKPSSLHSTTSLS